MKEQIIKAAIQRNLEKGCQKVSVFGLDHQSESLRAL